MREKLKSFVYVVVLRYSELDVSGVIELNPERDPGRRCVRTRIYRTWRH